jgi:hypothetical protein
MTGTAAKASIAKSAANNISFFKSYPRFFRNFHGVVYA